MTSTTDKSAAATPASDSPPVLGVADRADATERGPNAAPETVVGGGPAATTVAASAVSTNSRYARTMAGSTRKSLWYVPGNVRLSAPRSWGDAAYVGPAKPGSAAPDPSEIVNHFVAPYVSSLPSAPLSALNHGVLAAISLQLTSWSSEPGGHSDVP